jgi:hypothetical protein
MPVVAVADVSHFLLEMVGLAEEVMAHEVGPHLLFIVQ